MGVGGGGVWLSELVVLYRWRICGVRGGACCCCLVVGWGWRLLGGVWLVAILGGGVGLVRWGDGAGWGGGWVERGVGLAVVGCGGGG